MANQNINLTDKRIAIVTHRTIMPVIPGNDLKRFLLKSGVNKLIYITHPLLLLKESYKLSSELEFYEKSRIKINSKARHFMLPESISYIKDFIYTLIWVFKSNKTYDIYFGMNNLNAFAGLILKKLGRVKKVVYYTIDLFPQRFPNKLINWVYHRLDKVCVNFCDETWNVSPFLVGYRKRMGMRGKKYARQYIVPIGIWFDEIKRVPLNRIKMTKIVYVGHLAPYMGVDLAVRSIPLIKKSIPNIKLEIIGGGEQVEELKQLVNELSLHTHVRFHGWKDKKQAEKIITGCALGLAPFNTLIIDEKIKNADPAKIKDYLAQGLPVIMTNASVNARAIEKAKCGIIVSYTQKSLSNAIIQLLTNERLLREYKENALQYIKQFDWNILFTKNISRLL